MRDLLRVAGLIAVGAFMLAIGSAIAPDSESEVGATVPCGELPGLWSAATEVDYDRINGTITFGWVQHAFTEEEAAALANNTHNHLEGDANHFHYAGAAAEVKSTLALDGAECGSQPGLADYVAGVIEADNAGRRASCDELAALVQVVRSAYPTLPNNLSSPTEVAVTTEMYLAATEAHLSARGEDATGSREIIEARAEVAGRNSQSVDLAQMEESLDHGCGDDLGLEHERQLREAAGEVEDEPAPDGATGFTEISSLLGFEVDIPADWSTDEDQEADNWLVSYVGSDGGLRARGFDRPDRSPYVDAVGPDDPLPLTEAASEMIRLFGGEFGEGAAVESAIIDEQAVAIIATQPRTAASPTTVLASGPLGIANYVEILVWGSEAETILASLRFVP